MSTSAICQYVSLIVMFLYFIWICLNIIEREKRREELKQETYNAALDRILEKNRKKFATPPYSKYSRETEEILALFETTRNMNKRKSELSKIFNELEYRKIALTQNIKRDVDESKPI